MGGGPALDAADAPGVYRELARSPFASLYGAQSWAEDAADLVTFHHLTRVLGQPYAIRLRDGGKPLVVEPMKSDKVRARAKRIYRALSR